MNDRAERRVLSASRRRRSRRPSVERFEERVLLSTFTVNSTADSGPGTLRQAIIDSDASPAPAGQSNLIDFEIGVGARVIEPTSALPTITSTVAIDSTVSKLGSTQTIELRGDLAGAGVDGLTIEASGVKVVGLSIDTFAGSGIMIEGGAGSLIQDDVIGSGDPNNPQLGNGGDGVTIVGSNGNTIGGFPTAGIDVISGNGGSGVAITGGSSGNLIEADNIGVAADGLTPVPNDANGVTIDGSARNTIGAGALINVTTVISGNAGDGVELIGGSSGNVIQGSEIGVDRNGLMDVPNGRNGVTILDSPGNTVGGTVDVAKGAGNLIGGNQADGILISGSSSSGNSIVGNLIGSGLNTAGQTLGNVGVGVEIDGAPGTTIGGATSIVGMGLGNSIDGNAVGVLIHHAGASGSVVQGNLIGSDLGESDTSFDNFGPGVEIDDTSGNVIGGTAVDPTGLNLSGNLISDNNGQGVLLTGSATRNLVLGNLIGTDETGLSLRANSGPGVEIDGPGNTIGGTSALAQNTIVGQSSDAIDINGVAASGNLLDGNQIGLAVASTGQLSGSSPSNNGILVNGAPDNTIGGTTAGAGNIITNNGMGVVIQGGTAVDNLVEGNNIGLDPNLTFVGANTFYGVEITGGSANTIGGTTPDARNVISGNGVINVNMQSYLDFTSDNVIEGNFIGTDVNGLFPESAVTGIGVSITDSPGNAILDNLISGNTGSGLAISGRMSTGTVIQGNMIGTDLTGSSAVPNTGDGLSIYDVSGLTIGGTALGAGNVISGNGGNGVTIAIGSADVVLLGNLIGTDASSANQVSNTGDGVYILDSPAATIGGTIPGAANVISGNGGNGINIVGSKSSGTVVLGNRIGTDASGANNVGNTGDGVKISGSPDDTIGGTAAGSANVISGNGGDGVDFEGPNSNGQVVLGNLIGTDASGANEVGNTGNGVFIDFVSGVMVGGTVPGSINVISGNSGSGVEIANSSGDIVEGDFIGLDLTGENPVANSLDGVMIESGTADTVGGTAVGARNIISGNEQSGVEIAGIGSTGNLVIGNLIGAAVDYLNPTGNLIGVGNQGDGVKIDGGGGTLGNTIGGAAAGAGNVITANTANGVEVDGETATIGTGDVVIGNIIGLDTSTGTPRGAGNDQSGVAVVDSSGIRVGGPTVAERNIISGNARNGVQIFFSTGNLIEGNDIGSDASGLIDYGNSGDGILDLNGSGNAIGGPTPGQGNLIFGNGGSGVALNGTFDDIIQGNVIGLNAAGLLYSSIPNHDGTVHSLGNNEDGVSINSGGTITIGGTVAGDGNVISGNFKNGITVVNAANDNLIEGNFVGLDPTGLIGRGNRLNGIYITSSGNTVGGTAAGSGNVVSGNLNSGLVFSTSSASDNLVEGNLIGTDALGGAEPGDPNHGADGEPIGNRQDGVFINDDAVGDTIGGTAAGARNVISGNNSNGIQVLSINVVIDPSLPIPTGDTIEGNTIGLDSSGLKADGNAAAGIFLYNARGNVVGSPEDGGGNVISANLGSGVAIQGEAATNNVVQGNRIGTDATGSAVIGNDGDGVTLVEADDNTIGGLGTGEANLILDNGNDGVSISSGSESTVVAGNVISDNAGDGVSVSSGSNYTLIAGNKIGTDATGEFAEGNDLDGVRLSGAGLGSLVLSNVISANSGAGVEVTGFSSTAVIQGNLIGLDALGKIALGNAIGVAIDGVPDVVVGSLEPGLGNFISGNSVGVQVTAGTDTSLALGDLIAGNIIGLDASGTKAVGNVFGIFLDDAVGVTIGGTSTASRNVISGNTGAGVQVFRVSVGGSGNLIEGNTIGLDLSGMAVPTGAVQPIGVFLNTSANNTIGGTTPGSGNLISGNTTGNTTTPGYGISIFGQSGGQALDNVVEGNLIGTNAVGGALPLVGGVPVQTIGVVINTSAGNVIGGPGASARNGIGGNVVGVEVVGIVEKFPGQPTGNVIVGDTIDANTFGVYINEAQGNAILGDDLSRNTSIGLSIVGSLATGNTATGDVIDANLVHGVYIEAAASNGVTGATPNLIASNQINGNSQVGVYIALQANGNQVRRNAIRDNKQYGIFLYNSAANLPAVPRTGPDMNTISGSGIADFREFTGALTASTSTTTTTGAKTPRGPKSKRGK